MNIHLVPVHQHGKIFQFQDKSCNVYATKINDKWYPSLNDMMFDAGFCNISCVEEFFSKLDQYEESLQMLGFFKNDKFPNVYEFENQKLHSEISIKDDGVFEIISTKIRNNRIHEIKFSSDNFHEIENHIMKLFDSFKIDIFSSIIFSSQEDSKYVVEAKMSSKDLSKNLVRVKSSNIWSYGINIKNRKDKFGDVIIQFKDKNGGPGDLYLYFDVGINVWRRFLTATSKGHYFWQYIRNNYSYRKLTGDKKGKLPNAIN